MTGMSTDGNRKKNKKSNYEIFIGECIVLRELWKKKTRQGLKFYTFSTELSTVIT